MDLSAVAASVSSDRAAATGQEFSTKVLRKTLDMAASQGAQLAQMVARQSGLGGNIDTYA